MGASNLPPDLMRGQRLIEAGGRRRKLGTERNAGTHLPRRPHSFALA